MSPLGPFTMDVHVNAVPASEAFVALRSLDLALRRALPGWEDTDAARDVMNILKAYEPMVDSFRCRRCGWDSAVARADALAEREARS